ncbi:MAG TPA: hypothetical protein DCG53_14055 [Syntrophus sp. (in: bacteria)]|jgi:hypothetical protein|nr:hypothetical protein [Syntrophus sp. (in: bacteria)]
MIYSEKCKSCREDFNISYYNQLVSEFMLLSDVEKKSNKEAFDSLSETINGFNKESCVTCDDVFRFEKTLTRLRSLARIKMQIAILRDRYKALVGEKRFNTYLTMASKEGSTEDLVRADIEFILEALHQIYTLMPAREELRGELIERAALVMLVTMLITLSLGSMVHYWTKMEIFPIVLTIIFGTIGGYLGMVRRLQAMPANNDPTANFLDLRYGKISVSLAPISGAVFAVMLMLLFTGGVLTGTLFPDFNLVKDPVDFFVGLSVDDNASYAKLLVWSFIAGFAECLVPDTLDRMVARKQRETSTQPQVAMPTP